MDVHLVMDNYGTHKVKKVRNWGARLCLVHMESLPPPLNHGQGSAQSAQWCFEKALSHYTDAGQAVNVRVLDASVPEGSRRAAIEDGSDLVVVGRRHQRGTLSRMWSPLYSLICE
jgi:hypothetical protein